MKVAEQTPNRARRFSTMLPDTGERYLSTCLFDDINEGSDDDWLASLKKS